MSARAVVAGLVTSSVLVAVLGSPAAQDAAAEAENRLLGRTLTAFPSWDAGAASGDVRWSIVIRLAVLALTTALLCALAGRSGSRGAALLAGWAGAVVAAAAAGAAAYAYLDATLLAGRTSGPYLDGLVGAANNGAAYGLWTGWLVGVAVAAVTRQARATAAVPVPVRAAAAGATAGATPPGGTVIADPPAPWWAPTEAEDQGGEATIRPRPSAYPAGHMPPVVAGLGDSDTHVMSTVSGDPHPSDPDATPAVTFPRPPPEASQAPKPEPEPDPEPDPDATQVNEVESGQDDPTLHMPRQE